MDKNDILSIQQNFQITGRSPLLQEAISAAIQAAPFDVNVLVSGENGVGKEVFHKILHNLSPRRYKKCIAVNCGGLPEGTIDSELFGHVKGAYTGALSDRKGYFEEADGGTIPGRNRRIAYGDSSTTPSRHRNWRILSHGFGRSSKD